MITGKHYKYVDPEHLNEMAAGEDDFIIEIIDIYLKNIPQNISKLIEAAAGDDYAEIIFYTHKLRGSLNFIGGNLLILTLDKIDELCNAQTALPVIRQLVNDVITESHEITKELADISEHVRISMED